MHKELNYFGNNNLIVNSKYSQFNLAEALKIFYETNTKLNFSIISYLFWGVIKQTTLCQYCQRQSYQFQYYKYLSFPLSKYSNKKFNLYKGFKDLISVKDLKGDNQFYCGVCNSLRDGKIIQKIYYTSPYLLINLDYGKDKKDIPKNIDFGSNIALTYDFIENNKFYINYELISVITYIENLEKKNIT